jgi:hypothetical protein
MAKALQKDGYARYKVINGKPYAVTEDCTECCSNEPPPPGCVVIKYLPCSNPVGTHTCATVPPVTGEIYISCRAKCQEAGEPIITPTGQTKVIMFAGWCWYSSGEFFNVPGFPNVPAGALILDRVNLQCMTGCGDLKCGTAWVELVPCSTVGPCAKPAGAPRYFTCYKDVMLAYSLKKCPAWAYTFGGTNFCMTIPRGAPYVAIHTLPAGAQIQLFNPFTIPFNQSCCSCVPCNCVPYPHRGCPTFTDPPRLNFTYSFDPEVGEVCMSSQYGSSDWTWSYLFEQITGSGTFFQRKSGRFVISRVNGFLRRVGFWTDEGPGGSSTTNIDEPAGAFYFVSGLGVARAWQNAPCMPSITDERYAGSAHLSSSGHRFENNGMVQYTDGGVTQRITWSVTGVFTDLGGCRDKTCDRPLFSASPNQAIPDGPGDSTGEAGEGCQGCRRSKR